MNTALVKQSTIDQSPHHHHQPLSSPSETISDSDAIRNVSQKLLQQQQQIYQNQPIQQPQPITTVATSVAPIKHSSLVAATGSYPVDHYSNIPAGNYGHYPPEMMMPHQQVSTAQPTAIGYHSISDDVGLPPIQITKTIQTTIPPTIDEQTQQQHPVYQNQIMAANPAMAYHSGSYDGLVKFECF